MRWPPANLALAYALAASPASAFVPMPVGGHAGEVDASGRVTLERGKIEPNENPASFRHASWEVYQLGAGYTPGDWGPLQDVHLSLDGSLFTSPAEVNELEQAPVPAAKCLGKVIRDGVCEFYRRDTGGFVTPRFAFNVIHKPDYALGFYLQSSIPIGIDRARFVLPRIDYVAGGVVFGVHLTPAFGLEGNTYVGSGAFGHYQNAAIAQTLLFGLEAKEWLLPWGAGVKAGTYFEGDLNERFDERYDAAYSPGYPALKDRVRAFKFGVVLAPYVKITDHFAIELGYVQKLFGYDATATQTYYVGVRAAF